MFKLEWKSPQATSWSKVPGRCYYGKYEAYKAAAALSLGLGMLIRVTPPENA